MKTKQIIKNAFLLMLITGSLTACKNKHQNTKETTTKTAEKIQTVEVINPQNRSFTANILITGTAHPNQIVMLYAMESGVLSQIRKDIGDHVAKGETIAVLKNPELLQQQIKTEAELKAKQSIYSRLNAVYEKSPELTTIQVVENAEADFLMAKSNLEAVKSRLGFLTIKAPFSGIITKRFVDKGSLLQNGMNQSNPQAIVEIQDTNPIRLHIPVPETDAVAITKGMSVRVTFPELSGEVYNAKISRTSSALDPQSKTMQVEIDLNNTNGKIITGMYAKVLIQINSRDNTLSLPIMSKVRYKNEDYVLVIEDQKVKRIAIKIGLSDKEYFEVLNPEIKKESQIIVNGKGLVKPGQVVNPIIKSE